MNDSYIVIGGGGHAGVLCEILLEQGKVIEAIVSPESVENRTVFSGITHLSTDEEVLNYSAKEVLLVNGIGRMPGNELRKKLSDFYEAKGYRFASVISSNALISRFAVIEFGVQVLSGGLVQTGARIGRHSIINSNAVVEHDCQIGEFNHIAPNATVCGDCVTGSSTFIGAGATVIQGVVIGDDVVIGAGSVVKKNVASNKTIYPSKSYMSKG